MTMTMTTMMMAMQLLMPRSLRHHLFQRKRTQLLTQKQRELYELPSGMHAWSSPALSCGLQVGCSSESAASSPGSWLLWNLRLQSGGEVEPNPGLPPRRRPPRTPLHSKRGRSSPAMGRPLGKRWRGQLLPHCRSPVHNDLLCVSPQFRSKSWVVAAMLPCVRWVA